MSVCTTCNRESALDVGCYAGPFFFCSFLCRDTSEDLRKHQQMKARAEFVCAWCGARTIEPIAVTGSRHDGLFCSHSCIDKAEESSQCTTENCHVCSGAIRSRSGGGDP